MRDIRENIITMTCAKNHSNNNTHGRTFCLDTLMGCDGDNSVLFEIIVRCFCFVLLFWCVFQRLSPLSLKTIRIYEVLSKELRVINMGSNLYQFTFDVYSRSKSFCQAHQYKDVQSLLKVTIFDTLFMCKVSASNAMNSSLFIPNPSWIFSFNGHFLIT